VHTGFWCGNLKERDHLKNPGVDGRIILRWIFRNLEGRFMDWIDVTRDRQVAGCCKRGNETSGSIKSREFLD